MDVKLYPIRLTYTYEKIYKPTNEWASDYDCEPSQEGFIEDSISEFYEDIMNFKMSQRAQVEVLDFPIDIQWESWDNDD
jgi:hypothetical protein